MRDFRCARWYSRSRSCGKGWRGRGEIGGAGGGGCSTGGGEGAKVGGKEGGAVDLWGVVGGLGSVFTVCLGGLVVVPKWWIQQKKENVSDRRKH